MEKINKLKIKFKKEKIDGYLISKNDEFFNEYIPEHNDRLKYVSNFSGSYGFALLLKKNNYLFVDGRYSLQATKESGKFFNVVIIPNKMPYDILKRKKILIGFDPRLFTKKTLNTFFAKTTCKFKPINKNLVDTIWKRKKIKNKFNFYKLPKSSVGRNYNSKINDVVSNLKIVGADFQFITASENNAWLLNIRGRDAKYSPIPNSYILIDKNKNIHFFCDLKKITSSLKKDFKKISFYEIKTISKFLSRIKKKKFIIDRNTCSFLFENIISKNNQILNLSDPIYNFKAIKTKNEIKNMKLAHIYDGISLTKYLFWLKKNFDEKNFRN